MMWSIGNEVDLFYSNTKVWDVVQDIAEMIHEVDPNHPTNTVTAGLDAKELELIMDRAPDIDIYGINIPMVRYLSFVKKIFVQQDGINHILFLNGDLMVIGKSLKPSGLLNLSKPVMKKHYYYDRYNNHILQIRKCVLVLMSFFGDKNKENKDSNMVWLVYQQRTKN